MSWVATSAYKKNLKNVTIINNWLWRCYCYYFIMNEFNRLILIILRVLPVFNNYTVFMGFEVENRFSFVLVYCKGHL